ncbi:hypothetical protein [Streptomyces sp. NPDC004330]|uniref:hypothetical protein n=1 Tax=Streptomyces sp. NPDC004330 TaxID=3364700 RepID=UPI003677430A
MPRIRLAHWYGQLAPGTETEVTEEELAALQRDGRVAAVLPAATSTGAPAAPAAEAEPAESQDPPDRTGRKSR